VGILVDECSLYSNYLVHTSFLFGMRTSFPHLFIALHTCLQHERERPDMERKYMNSDNAQWKDPKLTTLVCSGWRHKYTKQASSRSTIYIVIEDSGWAREPVSGVATALLKTPRTQLKNRQKWHSLDICLKHIQNHNFSWSRTQK